MRVPIAFLIAVARVLSVACSSMLYHDTNRVSWKSWRTFSKFFGTTLVLGTGCHWALGVFTDRREVFLAAFVVTFQLLKVMVERLSSLPMEKDQGVPGEWHGVGSPSWQLERSGRLLEDSLGGWFRSRMACGWLGGVVLPLFCVVNPASAPIAAVVAVMFMVAGECIERSLFFRTMTTFKMPGNI